MGILTKLAAIFGGAKSEAPAADPISYKEFTIVAKPIKEGSQFRTAGVISGELNGEQKSVEFIRADINNDFAAAVEHSVSKAQQIIEEQGVSVLKRDRA